jgi:hypothetical protein
MSSLSGSPQNISAFAGIRIPPYSRSHRSGRPTGWETRARTTWRAWLSALTPRSGPVVDISLKRGSDGTSLEATTSSSRTRTPITIIVVDIG